MPVSAAKDFKACGKAGEYDLYEGTLMTVNGVEKIDHEQLHSALRIGITYTLRVNGEVVFLDDVTAEDISAIAAIHCNGVVYAPGKARGALVSKLKTINGEMLDIGQYQNDENDASGDTDESNINTGTYRM